MLHQDPSAINPSPQVVIMVQETRLVCAQTPVGSWICCAEDGAPSCARGFTPLAAAANWERAQELAE